MEKFFEDIQLDDIVFLNGFVVKKSTSDSKEINPKIQLVFNSVIYEKTTGRVMDYSEKISFNNKNGQIFSIKNILDFIKI